MQLVASSEPQAHFEPSKETDLSVIVPVFNEQESLHKFHHALSVVIARMTNEYVQIIYVNDGSTDSSWEILQQLSCPVAEICCINLSRNFGKEAAMTAGLDHARGNAVTLLDADLQDPPELIIPMLEALRKGYDIVNMRRNKRFGETPFKVFCAKHYYRLFRWLSDTPVQTEVGDFRMLSARVVSHIRELPERNRYMKGIMSWPGFAQTTLTFDRPERVAGNTKWSFLELCGLALSGITAFSVKPLRLATIVGTLVSASAFFYGAWVLSKTLIFGESVAGYPSLMLVVLFLGGIQLLGIGILGEYLGRVFIESKGRPVYLVMDNLTKPAVAAREVKHYG